MAAQSNLRFGTPSEIAAVFLTLPAMRTERESACRRVGGLRHQHGTGYYDAPTEYGSFALMFAPIKSLRTNVGYQISAVNGTDEFLNPLQVPARSGPSISLLLSTSPGRFIRNGH